MKNSILAFLMQLLKLTYFPGKSILHIICLTTHVEGGCIGQKIIFSKKTKGKRKSDFLLQCFRENFTEIQLSSEGI